METEIKWEKNRDKYKPREVKSETEIYW
jgi:hypothetical protein